MKRVGKDFQEFDSNSTAMVLLESNQPLGAEAHHYYDGLIQKLRDDPKHIEHIQDFWGDPLTAAGSQSADGKAAYVQLYLSGNQGESLANESIDAVQKIVAANPPPAGFKVYVTGPTAVSHDQHNVGDAAVKMVEALTIVVILVMLLLV
jgi:RND superfamily putative drug exporter